MFFSVPKSACCLLVLCCLIAVQAERLPTANFMASLVSRVQEIEPLEVREYRNSCLREPGCRWKCADICYCVCGSRLNKN